MLQQTGVERVIPAYGSFLDAFPTFAALADAPRVAVLRAWAGLGYNRRAVHLHECARAVVREHGGKLPDDPDALRHLPGLGPYTVAAVLSLAFGQDVAALDTNVRRVVARVEFSATPGERDLRDAAARLVPAGRSADWNQALMDFGSAVCTTRNPACVSCPLRSLCRSAASIEVGQPALRRVAERPETYFGSRRFYRGKIVALLRDLAPGTLITTKRLLDEVKPGWGPADVPWAEDLLRTLVAEGLADVEQIEAGWRIPAPR